MKEVSLIVTNYNGKEHLPDCLGSILNLNYPKEKLELILVDDASGDGSVDYVKSTFPAFKLVVNPKNLRFTQSVLEGVKASRNEYLSFINNDTFLDPDWLVEQMKLFENHPDCGATSAKMLEWDRSKVNFNGGYINYEGKGFEKTCLVGSPEEIKKTEETFFACGGGMVTPRKVFEATDGFDGDFEMTYEDVDYGWRLNLLGYKVLFCPQATMLHRSHAWLDTVDYATRAPFLDRNAFQMLFKNLSDENLPKVLSSALLLSFKRNKILQDQPLKETLSSLSQVKRKSFNLLKKSLKKLDPRFEITTVESFSYLNALGSLLDELPNLLEKRNKIQSQRKVPDKEIFDKFFPDPYQTWAYNEDHYRYLSLGGYEKNKRNSVTPF